MNNRQFETLLSLNKTRSFIKGRSTSFFIINKETDNKTYELCLLKRGEKMYSLKTEHSFDSAHFLRGYEGKCSNIHGHRWRVIIEIYDKAVGDDGQTRGMLVDFGRLKEQLKAETESLDHCLIIEKDSLRIGTIFALKEEGFKIVEMDFRPTAENFAKYFYDKFTDMGYSVREATVYETPKNCASYYEV